ncbi:hypothetical protein KLP28_03105 [Nocardioidaceae bacterium]|nr:hypothetical protein KLP28_03105 [Nocardioidaceae bacterium]
MSDLDPSRRPEDDEPGSVPRRDRLTPENVRRLRGSFLGMALLTAVGFVILASLTFVPWWAVVPLVLVWLVLMRAGGAVWFTTHPRRVLLAPAWLLLAWFAVVFVLAFTGQLREQPTVDPFPDPPTPPPSLTPSPSPSSSPSPAG